MGLCISSIVRRRQALHTNSAPSAAGGLSRRPPEIDCCLRPRHIHRRCHHTPTSPSCVMAAAHQTTRRRPSSRPSLKQFITTSRNDTSCVLPAVFLARAALAAQARVYVGAPAAAAPFVRVLGGALWGCGRALVWGRPLATAPSSGPLGCVGARGGPLPPHFSVCRARAKETVGIVLERTQSRRILRVVSDDMSRDSRASAETRRDPAETCPDLVDTTPTWSKPCHELVHGIP